MVRNPPPPSKAGTTSSPSALPSSGALASTLSEIIASLKVGESQPMLGRNANSPSLDSVRVDAGGQTLTTNQGVLVAEPGKRTPVFKRFSTVAGERGSADTVRDTRGFAAKFYTDDGNWDLVGNNISVFFIQDAMKFPDLA